MTKQTFDENELLPCPFCGKPAKVLSENDHHGNFHHVGCNPGRSGLMDKCPGATLFYTVPDDELADAIKAWNTRAAPKPADTQVQDGDYALALAALDKACKLWNTTAKNDDVLIALGQAASDHSEAIYAALTTAQAAPDGWRDISTAPKRFMILKRRHVAPHKEMDTK